MDIVKINKIVFIKINQINIHIHIRYYSQINDILFAYPFCFHYFIALQ